ncbi:MAG: hypothetical protein HW390_2250 [Candidatus Brocadiaceae bacterium]|nr:hypothetical protein [Candidatus Brocadiaceae bacterium]
MEQKIITKKLEIVVVIKYAFPDLLLKKGLDLETLLSELSQQSGLSLVVVANVVLQSLIVGLLLEGGIELSKMQINIK